jgi:hypothetical protein
MLHVRQADAIVKAAAAIMHADYASVQLYDPDRDALELVGHLGFDENTAAGWKWVYPDTRTSCGLSLRLRRPIVVKDVCRQEWLGPGREAYLDCGIRSVQTTPLMVNGNILGAVSTHWQRPLPTTPDMDAFARWVQGSARACSIHYRAFLIVRRTEARIKRSQEVVANARRLMADTRRLGIEAWTQPSDGALIETSSATSQPRDADD